MTSTRACRPGATGTRRSATAAASTPATRTATASARCTSTPWRVSGHCSAPGCVRIAASRRRSCQSISASLSSCTTRAGAEKPCSAPLSLPWSGDVLHHPGSRQEPSSGYGGTQSTTGGNGGGLGGLGGSGGNGGDGGGNSGGGGFAGGGRNGAVG